jgi:hypothetical protein
MTSIPSLDLTSPDHLVASLPYLLGFAPRESLVIVWTKQGRLLLTQRVDLPPSDGSIDLDRFASTLVLPLHAHSPSEAILIVAGDTAMAVSDPEMTGDSPEPVGAGADREVTTFPGGKAMPMRKLVGALGHVLGEMNVAMKDALYVEGGRFGSYLCEDACCPETGRVVDPVVANAVGASFALRGVTALGSRSDLVAVLEPDPNGVARLEPILVERELAIDDLLGDAKGPGIEHWRDEQVERIAALILDDGDLSDDESVTVLIGLCDVRVRDTVLWFLSRAENRFGCLDRLLLTLQLAPNGYVAPIATCAALVAWLLGDGARAMIAIERALNDDPEYSLAALIASSLGAGLPPAAWSEVMQGLSVETCRARPPAA